MAKIIENGKRIKYDNYEEYVKIQDSRYHDYDCPKCLKQNMDLLNILNNFKIEFKNLLDIGCRDAAYFDLLKDKGVDCYGIDISERSVGYAKSKGRNVLLGDAVNLSSYFDKKFDLIISCHSFEHLLKPEKVLEECSKVLDDDGHMAIRIPNEGDKIKSTKTMAHVRAYSQKDLTKILSNFKTLHFSTTESNEFIIIIKK